MGTGQGGVQAPQGRVRAWVRHRRAVWWRLRAWLALPVLSQCHCLCAWPPAEDQFPQQTAIPAIRGLGADAVSRCILGDSTKLTLLLPSQTCEAPAPFRWSGEGVMAPHRGAAPASIPRQTAWGEGGASSWWPMDTGKPSAPAPPPHPKSMAGFGPTDAPPCWLNPSLQAQPSCCPGHGPWELGGPWTD